MLFAFTLFLLKQGVAHILAVEGDINDLEVLQVVLYDILV